MNKPERGERPSSQTHWLLMDASRAVVGCHCGFQADMDSDCGYGDSVVDHLIDAEWNRCEAIYKTKLLALRDEIQSASIVHTPWLTRRLAVLIGVWDQPETETK